MSEFRDPGLLWLGLSPVVMSSFQQSKPTPGMLRPSSSLGNGLDTIGRPMSTPLKSLPDTRMSKYTTSDVDSGFGHSFSGPGRFSFRGVKSGIGGILKHNIPSSNGSRGHYSSALSDSYNYGNGTSGDPDKSCDYSQTYDHTTRGGVTSNGLSMNGDVSNGTRSWDMHQGQEHTSYSRPYSGFNNGEGILNTTNRSKDYSGYARDTMLRQNDSSSLSGWEHSSPSKSYASRDSGIFNDSRLNTSGRLDRSKSRSAVDMQAQLQDSEDRRALLMDKLADAKKTIKEQADQLERAEVGYRDTMYSLDDCKFREKEYRKKVETLEKEKEEHQNKRIESLKHREELQERISGLEGELKMLKGSVNLLESESRRKDEVLQQTTQAMTMMDEEQLKLNRSKENTQKELAALKESLDIARNRNEWLENQMQDSKSAGDRLQQDNRTLIVENRNLSNQLSTLKESCSSLKEEHSSCTSQLKQLREEKARLQRQLETFEGSVADLKATLATTSSDKERYFQEKLDLHQKMQRLNLDKETAVKERNAMEEQMNEMNAQVAEFLLKTDKEKGETRKLHDELAAVRKVGEVLSLELASTKANLEKCMEQNHTLEQTKKIAFQQHALYEQEIQSLESQVENLKKSMESIKSTHMREREGIDDGTIKLKDEVRQLRSERNQLELSKHELEARLKQSELNLRENNDIIKREMETWKKSCENLTAAVSRKEMEIRQLHKKLEDYENEAGVMKMNQHTFQNQCEEIGESREEILRLQAENRRLVQERAENQQVIQLLEMQKNILSKTVNDLQVEKANQSDESQSRVANYAQLQCQNEQLEREKRQLENKLQELEAIKEQWLQDKESKLERSSASSMCLDPSRSRVDDLEKQNKQLREVNTMVNEQLTRTEKELRNMRERDSVPRQELRRIELEKICAEENLAHLREQHKKLEETYHRVIGDRETQLTPRGASNSEVVSLRHEREALEQKVASLEKQITLVENSKKRAEDHGLKQSQQVEELTQKLYASSQDQATQMTSLQKQNNQLQTELEEAKSIQRKQDALIQSLKEELDDEKTKKPHQIRQTMDDVGNELNVMHRELQKLMGVISMKDQEISTLNTQLKNTKQEVTHRERLIDELRDSFSDLDRSGREQYKRSGASDPLNSLRQSFQESLRHSRNEKATVTIHVREKEDLQEKTRELENKTEEQDEEIERLRDTLKSAKSEMQQMQKELETMQDGQGHGPVSSEVEALRRELAGKNRHIENIEEQLRRNTSAEIRRLKREASKVELLKADKRRLENEIQRLRGRPERLPPPTGSQTESQDSDELDNSPLFSFGRHLKTHSMEGSEKSTGEDLHELHELPEDQDVQEVVSMLEKVELSDTLGMSLDRDDMEEKTSRRVRLGTEEGKEQGFEDSDVEDRTPRAEMEEGDSVSYSRTTHTVDASSKSRFSSFPTPTVASDTPSKSSASRSSPEPSSRIRARSASRSPQRSNLDRARSYDRTEKLPTSGASVSPPYYRSVSTDRAASRSYDVSIGYGSLTSSNGDLNARSLPHDSGAGPRYRSHLADLGPTPGETRDERRKRMRELLRTLDRPSQALRAPNLLS